MSDQSTQIRHIGNRSIQAAIKSIAIAALLTTVLFFSTMNNSYARYASVVMDSRTGEVLFSRNANTKLYPASLTKIMTLYMTFDALNRGKLKMGQKLKVSARAAGQTPTKLGLKKGSYITVKDAVLGLITKSANDAATVLAEAMAPTEAAFARKMTEQAKKIGMSRTSFRNASGLPNRRQKSTARDMAILGAALIHDFPQYYHYMSLQSFNYKGKKYKNHNNLLGKYAGADGIKTGYIRASGFNLVASAKRGDNRLIGVVFGGRTAKSRDRHMQKLLDKGFAQIETMRPTVIPLPSARPLSIAYGGSHTTPTAETTVAETRQIVEPPKSAQSTNAAAAVATASGNKQWGIQVGAFSRAASARDQLVKAKSLTGSLMEDGLYNIRRVVHNGTPIYRAQMKGFTRLEANNVCRSLQRKSVSCFIVVPETGDLMKVAQN